MKPPRPRFLILVEALPGRGDSRELAKALRALLRSFGLRVLRVEPERPRPKGER